MTNYANNIFAVQEMVNNCASEILESYANYENSRTAQKQAQNDNDEYNQLVDDYNNLLAKARKIAQYHREAESQNNKLNQINSDLVQQNQNLAALHNEKDGEILALKELLRVKDNELQNAKKEAENLRETVFTFTLVNTILSSKANALKNVLNSWSEANIYKKEGFIKALKKEVVQVDYAKNQIPATNSVEAFAYLESNNKPLFDKLKNISF